MNGLKKKIHGSIGIMFQVTAPHAVTKVSASVAGLRVVIRIYCLSVCTVLIALVSNDTSHDDDDDASRSVIY